MQNMLRFNIQFRNRLRHQADVSMWIPASGDAITLAFSTWTPGSYMIREYTKNIISLQSTLYATRDGEVVEQLCPQRDGKNRWILNPSSSGFVQVSYSLYCRENTVRTNWIEDDYAFLTGAATFPRVVGQDNASELVLELPETWPNVASALPEIHRDNQTVTLEAESYDHLVDSPIACGKFSTQEFKVADRVHRLSHLPTNKLWDTDLAAADTQTIVAEHQRFWGDIPYDRYWFINLITEGRGGLEHDNSTVLMANSWAMQDRDTYVDWLGLVSHEFFHTWNVRRLRPRTLQSYDYENEQHIEELWVAEGITSYFDDLAVTRCGLSTEAEYLTRLSKTIRAVQNSPGQDVQDLRSSSWDAWTKLYRPDSNTPNARISYYTKGALVAWVLDVKIQQTSGGKRCLDDLCQQLWQGYHDQGYTLDDVNELVERLSNSEVRNWLQQALQSSTQIDLEPALEWLGLEFAPFDSSTALERFLIGCTTKATAGRLYADVVFHGGAADLAGISTGDEIISIDGYRVFESSWNTTLRALGTGTELPVTISRRNRIRELNVTLHGLPDHNWELQVSEHQNSQSKRNYDSWLSTN